MTVHARGYRPLPPGRRRTGPAFLAIFRHGHRGATRGVGFALLRVFFVVAPLGVVLFLLNLESGPVGFAIRRIAGADASAERTARVALVAAIAFYHQVTSLFVPLLVLFSCAGLVADDVRTRALPLYLSRPVGPLDYFLGKWLVPVAILAVHVLAPGVVIVVFATMLRPAAEALPFLVRQADVLGTLLVHFAAVAVAYASLVVGVSALSRRRLGAVVRGALVVLGGGVVAGVGSHVPGALGEWTRGAFLVFDTYAFLVDGLGPDLLRRRSSDFPSPGVAAAVIAACFLACLAAVLRRARTTEVVA